MTLPMAWHKRDTDSLDRRTNKRLLALEADVAELKKLLVPPRLAALRELMDGDRYIEEQGDR